MSLQPVALINRSELFSTADCLDIAHALNIQSGHLASAGYPVGLNVKVYKSVGSIPPRAWEHYLLDDDPDVADALAYHDLTETGEPICKSFVGYAKAHGLVPTVSISHEHVEAACDPYCQVAVPLNNNAWLAWEVADPVEADSDGYDIDGVAVSDFVFPNWFSGIGTGPWDWTRQCSGPLQLRPGGYASVCQGGVWHQVTAEKGPDEPASRVEMSHRIAIRRRYARSLASETPMTWVDR